MISPDSIVRNARLFVAVFLSLAFIITSLNLGSIYREWSGIDLSTKGYGFTKTDAQMLFEEKEKEAEKSENNHSGKSLLELIVRAFSIRPLVQIQAFHSRQSATVSCRLVHVPFYIFERTLRL